MRILSQQGFQYACFCTILLSVKGFTGMCGTDLNLNKEVTLLVRHVSYSLLLWEQLGPVVGRCNCDMTTLQR